MKDNGKPDQQDEDVTFSNHAQKISECDYLIPSDSILRKIIPKKFSPNGKTIKRFIRGGANTCSNVIKFAKICCLELDKIKDPHFINIISKFHLISFVETWTNDNDNEIKIPGFHFVNGNNRKKT